MKEEWEIELESWYEHIRAVPPHRITLGEIIEIFKLLREKY